MKTFTYTYEKTSHPDLDRVVDREHNWTHYFHRPTKRYLTGITFRLDTGYTKGQRFAEYLKNTPKEEIERRLKITGERGDAVHQLIARAISGERIAITSKVLNDDGKPRAIANDEWDCLLSWEQFMVRHDYAVVIHEAAVFNLTRFGGYAGTLDVLGIMRKSCGNRYCKCEPWIGKLGLPDWKTSGGIWESFGAQVAACAEGENLRDHIGDRKIEYTATVRLGTDKESTGGYDLKVYGPDETKQHLREFGAACTISDAYVKPFDPEKEIRTIPDALGLRVAHETLTKPATRKPAKGTKVQTKKRNRKDVQSTAV